jgi:glutamate-1-semialdehyde 2,1-aminomutase
MQAEKSRQLFEVAKQMIPGGVNSPVRACKSVGAEPLFISQANGSTISDVDGHTYIDYVGSWGPMILGHRHPAVIKAIEKALERGTSFGAPTEMEIELADLIVHAVPSVDMVRVVNSGTEATMSAIRLARAATGRDTIIKFDGCYHGHGDALLVEAGSGVATLNIPGSPGVPESFVSHTLSLPYNDIECVRDVMEKRGDQVACIIVEPVAGNMGLVTPKEGFLKFLWEITQTTGSLLIFDEVMTGFRVALGGAQAHYGIEPDLTTLGKVIGGGLPVGAYGGRQDLMEQMAPQGPVYQAGTLSGNPVAMAAGIATLKEVLKSGFYDAMAQKTDRLLRGLETAADKAGVPVTLDHVGSMAGLFFNKGPVNNFEDAKASDLPRYATYFKGMRENGIYLAPSQFEAFFVSAAHSDEDIERTITAADKVFQTL